MYDFYYFVLVFMLFFGLLTFCFSRDHLLLTLLSLEFIVLGLYLLVFIFLSYYGLSYYFVLVFLTFTVCEAAVGLSILVSLVRSHGNDGVSSLSVLGW